MGYVDAFARYGAKLTNSQWSVSAFGEGGCLVLSLWQDLLKRGPENGTLEYRDTLSKWKGNYIGRTELQAHLSSAKASGVPVKIVIAHPATLADAALVGNVADESTIDKTFSVRKDLVGSLEVFDGDELRIVFKRAGQMSLDLAGGSAVPKGYWVTWYHSDVDPTVHPKYAELAGKAIASFGGRFLARGMPMATYQGGIGHRCVVIEFNSIADATAAYESAAYREALDVLGDTVRREIRIVEGQ